MSLPTLETRVWRWSAGGMGARFTKYLSYDNLTIMPKLGSIYNVRLIYKTSYERCKAFLRYVSLAKS